MYHVHWSGAGLCHYIRKGVGLKKLSVIWLIIAALVAVVTTVLQVEPAATIIELTTLPDGSFFLMMPLGITFILMVLPLFLVMFINNFIQNKKNAMPADLTGKTGVVIKRERELPNGALMFGVFVNEVQKVKVGMGKKVFIELPPGDYRIQIRLSHKMYSAEQLIQLEQGKILAFQTKTDLNKSITSFVAKGEMLFLVQVPFSK